MDEFIKYLESHIGDMYVWGAQGQCVSDMSDPEKWIKSKETSTANYNRAVAYMKKATKSPLYAFDCSGLIMYYFITVKGYTKADTTANGLYSQCSNKSKLTAETLKVGDLVFIYKGSKMVHVGVYIGGGYTIEAYGRDLGVVKRKLSQGQWTHQGRHPYLVKEGDEVAKVLKITSPLMRGDDIKKLQEGLNALGYDCGNADGICGKNTMTGVAAFVKAHGGKS